MLVRDFGVGSVYYSMITRYRDNPESLVAELPHHDSGKVANLAANLSIVRWTDITALATAVQPEDSPEICSAKVELQRRVRVPS